MSSLPVLVLPYPLVLFPNARITFPVSHSLADALLHNTLLAAFPAQPPPSSPVSSSPPSPLLPQGSVGCTARIARLVRPPARAHPQPALLSLHGVARIALAAPYTPSTADPLPRADVAFPPEGTPPAHDTLAAFRSAALRLFDTLAADPRLHANRDAWLKAAAIVHDVPDDKAPSLADVIVAALNCDYPDKLAYLSASTPSARLIAATTLFTKLTSITEVQSKIASAVDERLSAQQKTFFLRQQLAAIQRELRALDAPPPAPAHLGPLASNGLASERAGGPHAPASELDDDDAADADDLADVRRKIEAMPPGSEQRRVGVREWRRLKRIPQGSVENGVIRNYLEWLTAIPWPSPLTQSSPPHNPVTDPAFLARARAQLDADHFGLDTVKRRLIEYLAVVRLKAINAARDAAQAPPAKDSAPAASAASAAEDARKARAAAAKGPILLLVGPPGVGKTSLGHSVARALGRPLQRVALGGVRDEAEIRGHRRTYVASGPGALVQALRKAGRADPVVLLDEVDKLGGSSVHGDPGAALLEVLDPEQNWAFNDHYLNVPVDLSQVLFICTANSLDTISAPLLDRCEVIQLSGYTHDEKQHIARRFLLPQQLAAHGLPPAQLALPDAALRALATRYTREAGVRALARALGAVVRWKAVEWAEHLDAPGGAYEPEVGEGMLARILGPPRSDDGEREREGRRGLVYGLVVSGVGEGGVMPVESVAVPGEGRLRLTGSLGEVIKESGELALSWVKTHAYDLCLTESRAQDPLRVPEPMDIHLHLPAGAQKKDGPSAGIAIACAFVSLLTGAVVPPGVALTGELTLRGRVAPVGGLRAKILGAHAAGVARVVVPAANRADVEHGVPRGVLAEVQVCYVRTVREALDAAFGPGVLAWRREALVLESRL